MPTNLIKPTNRIEPTSLMQMVQAQNWAIIPEKLDAIHQVLAAHAAGQKIDIEAVKAETGNPMENEYNYQVLDGVAVVPVHGVIAKAHEPDAEDFGRGLHRDRGPGYPGGPR